jgi:hypothetical protein
VATLPLLYIARYADSGRLWIRYSAVEFHANLFRIFELIEMYAVVPLDVTAYRVALRTVLLALFALAFWKSATDLRNGRFTRAQLALAWGLLIMVSLPFLPDIVNGSFVFEERMAIWPVLLILLSASTIELDARASKLALLAGVMIGVSALWVLNLHLGPVARQLDVSKRTAVATAGAHAVLINDSTPPPDLTFNPYLWAGVRVAEQEHAILINSPWLDLSIMMLKPVGPELNQARFISNPKLLVPKFGNSSMIVVARCGDSGKRPSVTAWLRSTYARQWKFSQHSCFDMLQPAN